jgi:DNA topoisomerase-3
LVGINASRAATLCAQRERGKALSLGRVQTPTLAILVAREREIDAYALVPWWRLEAVLRNEQGSLDIHSPLVAERDTVEAARKDATTAGSLPVASFTDESHAVLPPLPFDLTELQATASNRFGMSAKRTLDAAQELYEAGYLSYPRTDSRYLTGDLLSRMADVFAAVKYTLPNLSAHCEHLQALAEERSLPTRCVNNSRVRDHHAIIPTEKAPENLTAAQTRIYELVAVRTVAAFLESALVRRLALVVDAGKLQLLANKQRVVEPGWTSVEPGRFDEEGFDVALAVGEAGFGVLASCEVHERFQPRPRAHSDATLLAAMRAAGRPDDVAPFDWQGIGTPATRADIIEKLIKRRFAMRPPKNGNLIAATDAGVALITAIEHLPLADAGLTADWERRLSALQEGDSPETFDEQINDFVRQLTSHLLSAPLTGFDTVHPVGTCPQCGTPVIPDDWKFACRGYREKTCDFVIWRWRQDQRIGRADAEQRVRENHPHRSRTAPPVLEPQTPVAESPLPAYLAWQPRALKGEAIEAAVPDIVEVEQPVVVRRVTLLLQQAAQLPQKKAQRAANRATAALVRAGQLVEEAEGDGQQSKVVRVPGTPPVKVRQRGPRDIDEIPLGELAVVMDQHDDLWSLLDLPHDDERVHARIALARAAIAAADET